MLLKRNTNHNKQFKYITWLIIVFTIINIIIIISISILIIINIIICNNIIDIQGQFYKSLTK